MALQLGQYQLPGAISAELVKPFLDYKTDGAMAMANALGNAGNNLGNAVGGMMQRNREEEKAMSLAGLGGMLSNGDFAGAANAAAQAGNPELAMKLGLAGYEHKQQSDSLAALGGMLGDSGGGGLGFGGAAGSTSPEAKSSTGGPSAPPGGNASYAYKKLQEMGYSPVAAAGIVGNLVQESGVRPVGASGDGGTAHGLAQWRGDRWTGLQNFARQNGLDPNSMDAQLGWLDRELKTGYRGAYDRIMGAKNPAEAAGAFGLLYERPKGAETGVAANIDGYGNRVRQAMALFGSGAAHEAGPQSPAPSMAAAGAAPMGAQANSGEVNGLMKQWDQINRAMMSPAFANAGEAGQNALKQRAEMIKTRLGMLGKTEGLPADYREYQLASSDPNFAKYMQDKRGASAQGEGAKITEVANARRQLIIDQGGNPDDPQSKQFILSGKFPREDQSPLTATDKKAILEADELVSANKSALEALNYAKTLSKKAMGFPGAGVISKAGSMVGNEASIATQELDNTVMGNALAQLKATFGGAPSDAEHKLLVELQGSSSQPDAVRQKIFDRAIQMATHKLEFNQGRADELRGGTYYGPNNGKPQQAAPQAHPMEGRTATNPQTGERMIFRNGNWAKY
jgi:hypothetical protein